MASFTSFSHKVSLKILWLQTGWGWEGAGAIGMNCCNSPCDPHDRTIVAPMSRPWSKHGLGRRASISGLSHTRPTSQCKVCIRWASTLRASIPATCLSLWPFVQFKIDNMCTMYLYIYSSIVHNLFFTKLHILYTRCYVTVTIQMPFQPLERTSAPFNLPACHVFTLSSHPDFAFCRIIADQQL